MTKLHAEEAVLRCVNQQVYVIEGRELIKCFRRNCERCRYLTKWTIDIAMGPISLYNLTIAHRFIFLDS